MLKPLESYCTSKLMLSPKGQDLLNKLDKERCIFVCLSTNADKLSEEQIKIIAKIAAPFFQAEAEVCRVKMKNRFKYTSELSDAVTAELEARAKLRDVILWFLTMTGVNYDHLFSAFQDAKTAQDAFFNGDAS
jgi:hypothetical protein